jgi:hypothetical protein
MLGLAYERIAEGEQMPGLIAVPQGLSIGQAIEELITVIECSDPLELNALVLHLPL